MITNQTRGTALATTVRTARTPWARFRGLMGRAPLPAGEALLLPGVKGVHTWFMRCAIDVVFYDRDAVVVDVAHELRPWRASSYKRTADGVIELPAGVLRASRTEPGDQLTIAFRAPPS